MGTNVYALRKNLYTDELYSMYNEAIKNRNDAKLDQINEELIKAKEENEIHIGKRSGGWKFLFDHNNWQYFDYTRESIDKFLKSCHKIVNEYGEEMTPEEFWKEYVDDMSDGMNGELYCKLELEKAYAKEEGKIEDKFDFYMTVSQARQHYEDGLKHNWYEAQICTYNGMNEEIPYDKLNYRFSYSTDFR